MSEQERRVRAIGTLFMGYRESDRDLAEFYVVQTAEIPVDILERAVTTIIRAHHWPKLPVVADLWNAARTIAGMHRERYHAGRYLPPATKWPPPGKRYAITMGEYESLDAAPLQLPAQVMAEIPESI